MDGRVMDLLKKAKTVAVVGISDKPERASHVVAKYLQTLGYRIIPINPKLSELLGEKCYSTLKDYGEAVDIVDIFRKSEAVPPIAEEAVAIGASCVWMQEGVSHEEAAAAATEAGLLVVQDVCIKKVLETQGGRP